MSVMEEKKNHILERLQRVFPEIDYTNAEFPNNRVDVRINKEKIPAILFYLKDEMGFKHLVHITCIDWIEEEKFELVFIVWSPEEKIKVFVRTNLDRNNPVMDNIDMIWRQANTYERELREMYGIQFEGLVAPKEFILEDWDDIPPMRMDFDTEAYAKKRFFERPGREDARDVRQTIAERTGEEIPEFAKKYSR